MKKLMTATKQQLEKALNYHKKKYDEATKYEMGSHHYKMIHLIDDVLQNHQNQNPFYWISINRRII